MKFSQAASILAFAAQVLGHGYIYRINADNTIYPGWDIFIDPVTTPTPARIAYGGGSTGPVTNLSSPSMACNTPHSPVPGAIATVRAGSNITFYWSHWLHSHKGPITTWMAPYEGDIAAVDTTQLEFVKIAEDIRYPDGKWAVDVMMDDYNGTWSATIPADIKPGNYIIRHELIALHFALKTPPGFQMFAIGPQFYPHCLAFKVTGDGTATPQGAKFPGAYKADEPGLKYDIFNGTEPYIPLGPALYKSKTTVNLTPNTQTIVSPTNKGADADTTYFNQQNQYLAAQAQLTSYLDSIGG